MNRSSAASSPFRFAVLLLGMMMAALLSACGGGGGQVGLPTGIALYTSAPAGVALAAGASSSYTVGGGNPLYSVSSSNKDVATATVSGTSFTITGVGAGSATISVTDAVGASVQVPVTVSGPVTPPVIPPGSLFTTAGGAVTVGVGANASFGIGGGKPGYAVSSSNAAVVTAAVSGAGFTVTGVGAGSAQVIVTDSAGTSLTLEVTVGAGTATLDLYTTAPNSVTIAVGAVGGYLVGGGKPAYAVSSSNAGVARVALNGTSFTITGVAAGSAQVVVFDASGDSIEIAVSIGAGGTVTPLFTTAPDDVRIAVGATAMYAIGGGKAPYTVSTSNAAVAKAAINGTDFIITGVTSGTAQIAVFDASGDSQIVIVTIGTGSTSVPLFTTAASSLTLDVGVAETYAIGGGKAPYAITSANSAIVKTALNGTDFTLTGMAAGSAQVTVTDATGAPLSLMVTVGSGATPTPLYTTAPGAITVAVNETATFLVGGGKPPYRTSNANATVVKATIVGSDLSVTGLVAGSAQVLVVDAAGTPLSIAVTVGGGGNAALFTSAPDKVNVGVGASATYSAAGGKPAYTVSTSNAAVATASISGSDFVINGVSAGMADIKVTDSVGASVVLTVTVGAGGPPALYTTAAPTVSIAVGAPGSYTIGGGAGGYSATTSNASVATVSISGSALTITALSGGSATVKVFDSLGAVVTIEVTALQSAIAVFPEAAGGNVGDSLHFLVSGGTAPYTITMNNTNIATVSPAVVNASGGGFDIALVNVGSTSATIVDGAGKSTQVQVAVSQISTILRLSPSSLLVGENYAGTVDLNIFGGTGPYRAFTSDQTLSSVSISGSTLTIGLGSRTNRCINPVTEDGTYIPNGTFDVTVTAVDSLGASATSVMTIKDNGFGLNAGCP